MSFRLLYFDKVRQKLTNKFRLFRTTLACVLNTLTSKKPGITSSKWPTAEVINQQPAAQPIHPACTRQNSRNSAHPPPLTYGASNIVPVAATHTRRRIHWRQQSH
jgi:hypothetical protein